MTIINEVDEAIINYYIKYQNIYNSANLADKKTEIFQDIYNTVFYSTLLDCDVKEIIECIESFDSLFEILKMYKEDNEFDDLFDNDELGFYKTILDYTLWNFHYINKKEQNEVFNKINYIMENGNNTIDNIQSEEETESASSADED